MERPSSLHDMVYVNSKISMKRPVSEVEGISYGKNTFYTIKIAYDVL